MRAASAPNPTSNHSAYKSGHTARALSEMTQEKEANRLRKQIEKDGGEWAGLEATGSGDRKSAPRVNGSVAWPEMVYRYLLEAQHAQAVHKNLLNS